MPSPYPGATSVTISTVRSGGRTGRRRGCHFFVGELFEDIGVVTHPEHRLQGLARSCASAVVTDIRHRRHTPTWTTSPDNIGSLAVAERLDSCPNATSFGLVRTPIPID